MTVSFGGMSVACTGTTLKLDVVRLTGFVLHAEMGELCMLKNRCIFCGSVENPCTFRSLTTILMENRCNVPNYSRNCEENTFVVKLEILCELHIFHRTSNKTP